MIVPATTHNRGSFVQIMSLSLTTITRRYVENKICKIFETVAVPSSDIDNGSNVNLLIIQRIINPARHKKRTALYCFCFTHDEYMNVTKTISINE
jgi:hypothetical protein